MTDLSEAKDKAQQEIFEGVSKLVKESARFTGEAQGRILVSAALAYRYAAGGAQPGGAAPEK